MINKASGKAVKAIVSETFPDYKGRKFYVEDSGRVTFHDTNWGGGTRNYYSAISLSNGKAQRLADYAPWANPAEGKTVEIPAGFAVVQRSIFCGQESGITIHMPLNTIHELTYIQ
jgi:hypothetical protein